MTEHSKFGGGASDTVLHPLVLAVMLVAILLVLVLPRKQAVVPFLLSVFFVPLGQQVVFGSLHFFVLRIIILAGCCRLIASHYCSGDELFAGGFTALDKIFIGWAISRAMCFVLLYQETSALTNQLGLLIDALGGYFVLRYLIRDIEDIGLTVKVLATVAFTLGLCMTYEHFGNHNLFGILGGVGEIPAVREGKIRCQGVFQHAIIAGVFGGTLVPMFLWLWKNQSRKLLAVMGIAGAVTMVLMSASSTPVLALLAGSIGLVLWPLRARMRSIRWGIVLSLVVLALVMKAPVWFVIAHVDLVGGSSGYQRALLVDQFIRHFSDWWLLGAPNNGDWGWDMWDVQNQFVAEGEVGGLMTFGLFIALVCNVFSRLGKTRQLMAGRYEEWFIWTLGAVMFAHVAAFFGANYFDQIRIWWYAFLAIVATVTASAANVLVPSTSGPVQYTGSELDFPTAGLGGHRPAADRMFPSF